MIFEQSSLGGRLCKEDLWLSSGRRTTRKAVAALTLQLTAARYEEEARTKDT